MNIIISIERYLAPDIELTELEAEDIVAVSNLEDPIIGDDYVW